MQRGDCWGQRSGCWGQRGMQWYRILDARAAIPSGYALAFVAAVRKGVGGRHALAVVAAARNNVGGRLALVHRIPVRFAVCGGAEARALQVRGTCKRNEKWDTRVRAGFRRMRQCGFTARYPFCEGLCELPSRAAV